MSKRKPAAKKAKKGTTASLPHLIIMRRVRINGRNTLAVTVPHQWGLKLGDWVAIEQLSVPRGAFSVTKAKAPHSTASK